MTQHDLAQAVAGFDFIDFGASKGGSLAWAASAFGLHCSAAEHATLTTALSRSLV